MRLTVFSGREHNSWIPCHRTKQRITPFKNVIQTPRNMSLDSEHNLKRLYTQWLRCLQSYTMGLGERRVHNKLSLLQTVHILPQQTSPVHFLGVDVHFYPCNNLRNTHGEFNLRSRPVLCHSAPEISPHRDLGGHSRASSRPSAVGQGRVASP